MERAAPPIIIYNPYYEPDYINEELMMQTATTTEDDDNERTHTDAIMELLVAAGSPLGKKRGKTTLLPYVCNQR